MDFLALLFGGAAEGLNATGGGARFCCITVTFDICSQLCGSEM